MAVHATLRTESTGESGSLPPSGTRPCPVFRTTPDGRWAPPITVTGWGGVRQPVATRSTPRGTRRPTGGCLWVRDCGLA
jgi:hypothetical protein